MDTTTQDYTPQTSPAQSNSVRDPARSSAAEHARRSIDEARASAGEFAAIGSEMLRNSTAHAQKLLSQTGDQAAHYVQAKPLKALLIAAAAGAGIAMLAGMMGKSHNHHHSHR